MSFDVLGPLTVRLDADIVELTGQRQRTLLARLLVAKARVVPVDRLIDDLWGEELPEQPVAAIQAFVSRLRRQIEPGRRPRSTASVLITSHPGYALRPGDDDVDAWRFERLIRASATVLDTDPGAALDALDVALGLWRGEPYSEFTAYSWARAEADRLDDLRRGAVEDRADACLRLGRPQEVISALRSHVVGYPMRERAWALLAAAHYATGNQGDALATLRRARAVLVEAIGVDPGPALRALEADILAQADHLATVPPPRPPAESTKEASWFVGREPEIEELLAIAERGGIVQLVGDPGAGKTAVLDRLSDLLAERGWLVGRGRCAETGGALPGWPWIELVRALARAHPPQGSIGEALGWLLRDDSHPDPDPVIGQHRIRRGLRDYLVDLSGERRILLTLDDVHRADEETLALLISACAVLADRPALVVVARRGTEVTPALDEALAHLARHEPHRLALSGLDRDAITAVVEATAGRAVAPEVVAAITDRTGGNPFFVRESARLLATGGPQAALSAVPDGVQEVLGQRIARLPTMARGVLNHASVLGRDITLDLLMDLSGETEEVVLEAVDAAVLAGLLLEPRPGVLAFPHSMVRDAVYRTMSHLRRARLHVHAAAAVQHHRPDDVTAIAFHYETAGDPALANSTLHYARLASGEAERRYAFREAVRWLQVATAAAEQAGSAADRLEVLVSLVRALASAGDLVAARALRSELLAQLDAVEDPRLAAVALTSYDVPTLWTSRPYGTVDLDVVQRAENILDRLPPDDSEPRCRLLINIALELEGEGDERGFAATRQAESMARRIGDPHLLTMALNATLLEHFAPGGHEERRRAGAELLRLGDRADIVSAQVLGHMAMAQTASAAGEMESADQHIAAVESLAELYDQPLTAAITAWYHGLRHLVAGNLEEALAAYAAAERLWEPVSTWQAAVDTMSATSGCAWLSVGRLGELAQRWDNDPTAAGFSPELHALALAHAGRIEEARRRAGAPTPIRRDYAMDLHWTVRGLLGIALNDSERSSGAYRQLLPYPHLLAGAGSGVLVIAPVAEVLGDLAAHRGDRRAAATHYAQAIEVAQRAGAPHWAERAAARLS